MPQLNPAPWFMILVLSWVVFLMLMPGKVMNNTFTNDLTVINSSTKTKTWNWPWY